MPSPWASYRPGRGWLIAASRLTVLYRALRQLAARLRQVALGPPLPWNDGDLVEVDFGERGGGQAVVGATVLEAARSLRVSLDHFCGGCASCGTCRVIVRGETTHLSPMEDREKVALGAAAVARGDRLACQARIRGPIELAVPSWFNA